MLNEAHNYSFRFYIIGKFILLYKNVPLGIALPGERKLSHVESARGETSHMQDVSL